MKNHGKFIAAVLILIVCSPPDGTTVDLSTGIFKSSHQEIISREPPPGAALMISSGNTGHIVQSHRKQRHVYMQNYSSELLAEIEKDIPAPQKNRDQQADILEKILESAVSEATPHPQKP